MNAEHRSDVRRVTVGVDGSEHDRSAVEWAAREAVSRRVGLHVFSAYEPALPPGLPYESEFDLPLVELDGAPAEDRRGVAEHVAARAADLAQRGQPTATVTTDVVSGRAAPLLIDQSRYAELLVLGSRRAGPLGSIVLGSVSAAVAGRAHCPVVVVRGPRAQPGEPGRVVVGLEGGPHDQGLLEFGFDFAARTGVAVHAVLCWPPDLLASMSWRGSPPPPDRAARLVSEALAGWSQKYPDVEVHHAVIRDHPVPGLIAESLNQELLVVGTRGRHALAGTLLGSVSQGVLHHANLPVAVIPIHS